MTEYPLYVALDGVAMVLKWGSLLVALAEKKIFGISRSPSALLLLLSKLSNLSVNYATQIIPATLVAIEQSTSFRTGRLHLERIFLK
jgi:hypothetical protein